MKKVFFWVALAAGLAFLFTVFLTRHSRFYSTDFALTVKLQDKIPVKYDDDFGMLVDLGSMEVQAVIFVVVLVLLPVNKKTKLILTATYVFGLLLVLLGKNLFPHPAPPFLFQRTAKGLPFPSMHVQVQYSFPSGHTFRTIFLTAMLVGTAMLTQVKKIWLLLAAGVASVASIILVGLVVLGMHWTSDVIGGASLAVCLVFSSFWLSAFLK